MLYTNLTNSGKIYLDLRRSDEISTIFGKIKLRFKEIRRDIDHIW